MKTRSLDLGAFIRDQRQRSALSVRKLADQAGISNPYLSQIERGLRKPSADILAAIAGALGLRTEHMFERAGLLDRVEPADVVGAIEAPLERALLSSPSMMDTEICWRSLHRFSRIMACRPSSTWRRDA